MSKESEKLSNEEKEELTRNVKTLLDSTTSGFGDTPSPKHLTTPKKSSTKSDVDSIGGWSETISINVNVTRNRAASESLSEEKKSLLEIGVPGSRRTSANTTSGVSVTSSPRPGSRGSRHSRRHRSSRGKDEHPTRGELLMDMVRHDSVKSCDSRGKSPSLRDSVREKNDSTRKKRKNSSSTSSSSSTSTSLASDAAEGKGFSRKGKRGYMTAKEAVKLGDVLCGCMLKDKLIYFLKPIIFLTFGSILITGGLVLTVLHFMYEDTLVQKNPVYFTYGTMTLSTGVILFMVGLVWVPIKQQKWKDGTASPMLAALAKWRFENLEKEGMQVAELGLTSLPSYDDVLEAT